MDNKHAKIVAVYKILVLVKPIEVLRIKFIFLVSKQNTVVL